METWNASHGGWPAASVLRSSGAGSRLPGTPSGSGRAGHARQPLRARGVWPAGGAGLSQSTANRDCTVQMLLLSSSA